MTYAIVQLNGKQYRVAQGEQITVDRVSEDQRKDDTVTLSEVLLVHTDAGVSVGAPFVSNATVTCKVVSDNKSDKLRIFKYKAKSRTRRTQGHRQHQTTLEVSAISA